MVPATPTESHPSLHPYQKVQDPEGNHLDIKVSFNHGTSTILDCGVLFLILHMINFRIENVFF